MKIFVKAKVGQREQAVEKISENTFIVKVRARAEQGRANQEIIAALAAYLKVPKSNLKILSGHTSRTKLLEWQK